MHSLIQIWFARLFLVGRLQTSVSVNCMAGVSQSATLVAGYLVRYHLFSADQALARVKRVRKPADPIPAFRERLAIYARHCSFRSLNDHLERDVADAIWTA